jgi:hypothetical protein
LTFFLIHHDLDASASSFCPFHLAFTITWTLASYLVADLLNGLQPCASPSHELNLPNACMQQQSWLSSLLVLMYSFFDMSQVATHGRAVSLFSWRAWPCFWMVFNEQALVQIATSTILVSSAAIG